MQFTFSICPISGLFEIQPKKIGDNRGYIMESYSQKSYEDAGIAATFEQDNQSSFVKGVLRGLHYQKKRPQGKLLRVIEGEIFDVAVDIRPRSPTCGQWYSVILSGEKQNQFFIPEGFAHGYLVLSDTALLTCRYTDVNNEQDEYGIIWNDPDIAIKWPNLGMDYIISDKDKAFSEFNQ